MIIFHKELRNRCVKLNNIVDIVRFSFIVRNSLSHLNLQLLEYSDLNDRSRTTSEVANDFICTEEKCRKIFSPNRSLLYNLNLDIPVRREYRLKNDLSEDRFHIGSRILHIGKITQGFDFDFYNTTSFLDEALSVSNQNRKLKILGLLVKSVILKKEFFYYLAPRVINNFIHCLYPEITDFVLFKDFAETSNFRQWMSEYEKPEILEHLLFHSRRHGIIIEKDEYPLSIRIDYCICSAFYSNINPFLKYTDAHELSSYSCILYQSRISFLRPDIIEEVCTKVKGSLSPKRLYLILQIFYMYIESNRLLRTGSASEALRLLWSSSPVALITYGEIKKVLSGVLTDEEVTGMYEFYSNSIDEDNSVVKPRPLKHLCRTIIRRILKNNFWIPEGVRLTGLPKSLQSYLNLEKIVIPPYKTGL